MTKRIDNFKKLIKFFETKTINYALLGRKDSLNEIIDGDIDIVVSQDDFKNIELLNLCGCTDPKATNYKSYFVKSDNLKCIYN